MCNKDIIISYKNKRENISHSTLGSYYVTYMKFFAFPLDSVMANAILQLSGLGRCFQMNLMLRELRWIAFFNGDLTAN